MILLSPPTIIANIELSPRKKVFEVRMDIRAHAHKGIQSLIDGEVKIHRMLGGGEESAGKRGRALKVFEVFTDDKNVTRLNPERKTFQMTGPKVGKPF